MFNFLRTGMYNWVNGVISYRSSGGYWWSNIANVNSFSSRLLTDQTNVIPQSSHYRGYGFAIRCVIREGQRKIFPPKTTSSPSSLLPMVSKVMRLALPSYVLLLSTLPTLAGTSTKRASWLMLLRVDMLGRVPCTLQRVPTACTSVVVVFFRSISPVVVTVAPYAASRSRVDSTLRPCFTHGRRQDETLI